MYTYPKPEHVFPVVDWQDGLPVVAATGALVKLVASQADPTFPALDVDSPALWDAVLLFRRFKVRAPSCAYHLSGHTRATADLP